LIEGCLRCEKDALFLRHSVNRRTSLKTSVIAGTAAALAPPSFVREFRGTPAAERRRATVVRARAAGRTRVCALEHIRRMRGGSQSHLMRCSDGHHYVVKFQNNPQHRRILVNEMLATRLAADLGLPTAPMSLIYVPQQLIELTPDLSVEMAKSQIPCEAGMQFGSRYLGEPRRPSAHPSVPRREWDLVENRTDFAGMFVFDKWTCNTDGRQVLFQRENDDSPLQAVRYKAVMIDQGFCFNGGGWSFLDSPIRNFYFDWEVYRGVLNLDSFEPWLSRLESEIDLKVLVEATLGIAAEWYEFDTAALRALLERLDRRRHTIREMLLYACQRAPLVFPNWQRAT
jgi:hypothetical protein